MTSLLDPVRTPLTLRHGSIRYELLEFLGGGGSGDVHLARIVGGLERRVCIKRLRCGPTVGAGAPTDRPGVGAGAPTDCLREEARLLAGVRHANVVSLLGFGEDEHAGPFLVLEYVEGLDLRALGLALGGRALADGVAVHIACALLRALSAVQRCLPGLVHRDVTPHNVLVSRHGEVKLGDFGIALTSDRLRAERSMLVKGKLGYMSPEQVVGAPLDPRSDLFAVGVVLYELLSGERPWGSIRAIRDVRTVLDRPATPLHAHRPDLPWALASAVDRLVERAPGARFACADDALRALAAFGAGELGSLRLASLVAAATS